jgi:hypothetical protein
VRYWWAYRMPNGNTWRVPGRTAQAARALLAATCYPGCPVGAWPRVAVYLPFAL